MPPNGRPIADCYWVFDGELLAGRRPAATAEEAAAFLDAGVTRFIDLTYDGEFGMPSYVPVFAQAAVGRGRPFEHQRFPIVDRSIPTIAEMKAILTAIDRALDAGERVYLHCFGGIGRTGTVVACYLVRDGRTADEALRRLIDMRHGIPSAQIASPETNEQRAFVRGWSEHEDPGDV